MRMLDTAEAVQYLGQAGVHISCDSVQRWARAGKLPRSVQLPNRQWRHHQDDLRAILEPAHA